jgi:biotin carboxyl carrier protein
VAPRLVVERRGGGEPALGPFNLSRRLEISVAPHAARSRPATAPIAGTVTDVAVRRTDQVTRGQPLAVVEL